MKTPITTGIIGVALFFMGVTDAAQINVTFDNVPPQVQCGQTWTNNNVILSFGETTGTEGVGAGYCSFRVDPGYVWLYPARLLLDFSLLSQPVSGIEADVAYGISGLYAYRGTNNIGQDRNAVLGTLSLNFTNLSPDYCAISGGEGTVSGVRLFTGIVYPPVLQIEQTNGVVTVLWQTNQNGFVLESRSNLANPPGWITQTNNIQFDGSNFFYQVAVPAGTEYFRLRH